MQVAFKLLYNLGFNMGQLAMPPNTPYHTKTPAIAAHLLLATLAINLLGLALPLMTLQIYDRVIAHRGESTLMVLAVGVLVAAVIECISRIFRANLSGWAGAIFEHALSRKIVFSLLAAPLSRSSQTDAGDYVQAIGAAGKLREHYSGQLLHVFVDVPFIFIFLGLITYLSGWLVCIPLSLLLGFFIFAVVRGAHLKKALRAREHHDYRRLSFTINALRHIHTAKALALEAPLVRRFEQLQARAGLTNYLVTRITGQIGNMGYFFAQAMMVLMVTAGAPLAVQGHITTGTLIACVLLSGRIMQPLQKGLSSWVRLQDIVLAQERMQGFLSTPAEEGRDSQPMESNEGSIKLEDVTFRYAETDAPVVRDVSLTLLPGESIAITGDRSTGKTTLLELMAGLHPPGRGSVLLNGKPASHYESETLMQQVGYMPTLGQLLHGSIFDNLTGFRPERMDDALEAARLLGIDEAVKRLPTGYDTILESAAAEAVPPGLRQRIAIARVLIERPRILLFDNADRALDRNGYNHLFTLLGKLKGKITMVLVSDDKNILSLADRTLALADGRIVERVPTMPAYGQRQRSLREVGL